MLINEFVNGKNVISVKVDGSIIIPDDLVVLEQAIDEAAGYHISNRSARGFAEYCIKILEFVKNLRHPDDHNIGIEVCLDEGRRFGYMKSGTRYFLDQGMEVVDASEFLREFNGGVMAPEKEDFFEILK